MILIDFSLDSGKYFHFNNVISAQQNFLGYYCEGQTKGFILTQCLFLTSPCSMNHKPSTREKGGFYHYLRFLAHNLFKPGYSTVIPRRESWSISQLQDCLWLQITFVELVHFAWNDINPNIKKALEQMFNLENLLAYCNWYLANK